MNTAERAAAGKIRLRELTARGGINLDVNQTLEDQMKVVLTEIAKTVGEEKVLQVCNDEKARQDLKRSRGKSR